MEQAVRVDRVAGIRDGCSERDRAPQLNDAATTYLDQGLEIRDGIAELNYSVVLDQLPAAYLASINADKPVQRNP